MPAGLGRIFVFESTQRRKTWSDTVIPCSSDTLGSMPGKRVQFDYETWQSIDAVLSR
jgi:hypothetical protein